MSFKANCYVKHNKANRTPKRIVCLDTECRSVPNANIPNSQSLFWRLGCASYDRLDDGLPKEHRRFETTDIRLLWHWICGCCSEREKLWVFAHNLIFDLSISDFWGFAKQHGIKITRYVIEDPPSIIDAEFNGCKIRMVDTMNYIPVSLATLGEYIGVSKWDMPSDDDADLLWTAYCRNDVEILRKFSISLINAVNRYDLGNFQPTIASQSMSAYRHRFMHHAILPHDNLDVAKLERKSYFGGRVYCGYIGEAVGPIRHVDCNSLYPTIMDTFQFPAQLLDVVDDPQPSIIGQAMKHYHCMASVRLKAELSEYPVRRDGRIVYARGKYNTVLCGPELYRAYESGEILGIERFVTYKVLPIFVDWCDYWKRSIYAAKDAGDKLGHIYAKMMANSLSGKWAQKPQRWESARGIIPESDYSQWWHYDVAKESWHEYRSVAGCVQYRTEPDDLSGGMVAISAAITSYARVFMDGCRRTCGDKTVYYQDTDSLIMKHSGLHKMHLEGSLDERRFGAFKDAGTYNHCRFDGPRRWYRDGQIVAPGIKADAAAIADGVFRQETWQGARTLLANDPVGSVTVRENDITLTPIYLGCNPGPDGWTRPLELDD